MILAGAAAVAQAGGPAPYAAGRKGLERHTEAVAAAGRSAEMGELIEILQALGISDSALVRLRKKCDAALAEAGAEHEPQPGIAKNLRRVAKGLARTLGKIKDEEERRRVARQILRLDGGVEAAHTALGHEQVEGRWIEASQRAQLDRARAIAEHVELAKTLPLELDIAPSVLPAVQEFGGKAGIRVRWENITLHGAQTGETKLTDVMNGLLRALALSNWIQGGEFAPPKMRMAYTAIVCGSEGIYREAIDKSIAAGGLSKRNGSIARQTSRYEDTRGFRVVNSELAGFLKSSLIVDIWHHWISGEVYALPQPAPSIGHCNWLSLSLYERTVPGFIFVQRSKGTSADDERRKALLVIARRSVTGTLAYVADLAAAGDDPEFAASIGKRIGRIDGDELLKCTAVAAYLHEVDLFAKVIRATAKKKRVPASFEESLGEPVHRFEQRVREWLAPQGRDIAARLE
jgi:hypothetical protein